MQPPRQLVTLDDLLAQAEHYADFCMRYGGTMVAVMAMEAWMKAATPGEKFGQPETEISADHPE